MDNDYAPFANEEDAKAEFDEMLDEVYESVKVCGYTFNPARALKQLDPIAYREEFNNWLDSRQND